ncbi:MAG: hypothetical protein M1816_000258 [Peltula sp. TS41687]|nr:MAG: hypothetical protein M1816_000258 [Peltula sp. TS41687]
MDEKSAPVQSINRYASSTLGGLRRLISSIGEDPPFREKGFEMELALSDHTCGTSAADFSPTIYLAKRLCTDIRSYLGYHC